MQQLPDSRPLTADEYRLVRWMLEHGGPQALAFLPQIETARATTWRCPCGCASWEFHVDMRQPGASPVPDCSANYLCDFYFEEEGEACGILLSQVQGVLREVQLWSTGDAPKALPQADRLQSFQPMSASAQGERDKTP